MNFRFLLLLVLWWDSVAAATVPIDTAYAVPIGGIQQWISVSGKDRALPVLLFLHGGPGNSAMGRADKFTAELRKHFVVVMWDQRGAGRTRSINPGPEHLELNRMIHDAEEIVDYLCRTFHHEKIVVVGHSWGGFLALLLTQSIPGQLKACVAVAPMLNQLESDRVSLDTMRQVALRTHREDAIRELSEVKIPFKNAHQLYLHRKWTALMAGGTPAQASFVDEWAGRWLPLYLEASGRDLTLEVSTVKCPLYFFLGKKDYTTFAAVSERFYQSVKAEKKELIWFLNSGHSLNLTEPNKFQETLIRILKP